MNYRQAVNAFFFVNGFLYGNWAMRLPDIQVRYDVGNDVLGYILLSYAIGAFLGMPTTGWLIHQFTSKRVTWISGVLVPVCFVLIPFMPTTFLLFFPFFFMGMSSGIKDVAMNAQAVEVERYLKKPIMTMFHALFSIGMVVGAAAGGFCMRAGITLQFHFLIVAFLGFAILIIAGVFLFPDNSRQAESSQVLAWPKGPIVLLGIIAFCCMLGEGAMADWSTNYMKQIIKSPVAIQTYALIAFTGGMTLGRVFGDKSREVVGDFKTMLSGGILAVIGMAFILFFSNPWVVIVGFGAVGLGLSNIVPIVYSLAGSTPGIPSGTGIAMSTTIGYTGFMFGPTIIGWVGEYKDLRWGLAVVGVLMLIMLFLLISQASNYKNRSKESE